MRRCGSQKRRRDTVGPYCTFHEAVPMADRKD